METQESYLVFTRTMDTQALEVRQKILTKAREKFRQLGYQKTAVDEIAAELGMSKKTLYKYFPSKLKLFESLIAQTMAEVNARSDAILASPLPAVEKLFRIVQMIAEQQRGVVSKVMLESLRNHLPQQWQRIDAFRRERMRKNMTAILDQGRQDGTVRQDLHNEMFIQFLLAALEAGLSSEVLVNASYSLHEALLGLMDIFMNGALTAPGREQFRQLMAASMPLR